MAQLGGCPSESIMRLQSSGHLAGILGSTLRLGRVAVGERPLFSATGLLK